MSEFFESLTFHYQKCRFVAFREDNKLVGNWSYTSCSGLIFWFSVTILQDCLFHEGNLKECLRRDFAYIIQELICGIRTDNWTSFAKVILNRIQKLHFSQLLQTHIQQLLFDFQCLSFCNRLCFVKKRPFGPNFEFG